MRFAPFRRRQDASAEPPPWNEGETLVAESPPRPPPVVEEEVAPPPPPPRGPLIWPWLLLLLVLVAGGLVAWWLISRDDDNGQGTRSAVIVPSVVGERQDRAFAELNRSGLTARIETRPSSAAAGTVFDQQPDGGARVARGSNVTLSVSAAETVVVPDVVGKRAREAVSILRGKGLLVETVSVGSNEPSGTVLGQSPAAGKTVGKGSTVQIRVSRGLVLVPDVTGQSRGMAVSTLRGANLVPLVVNVPSPQARGIVVAQRPLAGKRVPQGSKVQLNVSRGQPAPTTTTTGASPPPPPPPAGAATRSVPDVKGQRQEAAQRTLNGAGFKAGVVYVPSDDPQGTVVSQSPAGGLTRPTGTRIQLNVSLGPSPGTQKVVPEVVGLDPQTARARLSSAGFNVQTLSQKVSSRSQNGKVVDEQPAGGRRAPARSTVTIYVGRFG
jgi:beta-lactam-binding protein with PASTA domain